MPRPYFRSPWPSFAHDGTVYDLTHLDEMYFDVIDAAGHLRKIAVTFEDHCFTRKPDAPDASLVYPDCSRNPGHFCFERYQSSLALPALVLEVARAKVWNVEGRSLAYLPLTDADGVARVYQVIFSLHRVKQLPVDLHMRVETAYLGERPIATYGSIQFSILVKNVMTGVKIRKDESPRRKRPRTC